MSNPNGKRPFNPTISNANKRLHRTTIGGVPVQHNNEPPEFDSFGQQRLQAQPPPRLSQLQQQQQMQQQEPQHYSAASSSSTSKATQPPARKPFVSRPLSAKAAAIVERFKANVNNPPVVKTSEKLPESVKANDTQKRYLLNITGYLNETGYQGEIPRIPRDIGNSSFQAMFKHMVLRLLPTLRFDNQFNDDFFEVIRILRYPFTDSIKPKSLSSIGALHTLPTLYCLLQWLMICCKSLDIYLEKAEQRYAARQQNQDPDVIDKSRLLQEYTLDTYHAFMQNKDFKEQNKKLDEAFGRLNSQNQEIIDTLRTENARLRQTLEDLKSQEARLEAVGKRNEDLHHDLAFYEKKYQEKLEKANKYKSLNSEVVAAMNKLKRDLESKEAERDQLRTILQVRNLSEEQILAIENEHDVLVQTGHEIDQDIQKKRQAIQEKEARTVNMKHNLQRSVDERNRIIQNISMPSTSTTDPRKDHPYQIIYDPQGKTREEAVGPDLSAGLIPLLEQREAELRQQHNDITEELYSLREQIESLKANIKDKEADEEALKERLESRSRYYEKIHAEAKETNRKYNQEKDKEDERLARRKKEAEDLVFEAKKELQDAINLLDQTKKECDEKEKALKLKAEQVCNRVLEKVNSLTITTEEFKEKGDKKVEEILTSVEALKSEL